MRGGRATGGWKGGYWLFVGGHSLETGGGGAVVFVCGEGVGRSAVTQYVRACGMMGCMRVCGPCICVYGCLLTGCEFLAIVDVVPTCSLGARLGVAP